MGGTLLELYTCKGLLKKVATKEDIKFLLEKLQTLEEKLEKRMK